MLTLLFMFSSVFALDPYTNLTEPREIFKFFQSLDEFEVPVNAEFLGKGYYGKVFRLNETQVVKVIPVLQDLAYLGQEEALMAIKWDFPRIKQLNTIYLEVLTNLTLKRKLKGRSKNFKIFQELAFSPKTSELMLISEDLDLTLETLLSPLKPKESSPLMFVNENVVAIHSLISTVCSRIAEIHEIGFGHFDVRDANIMFHKEGHLVLIDLGYTQPLNTKETRQVNDMNFNLLGYEYFEESPMLTHGGDMWALGFFILQTCTFEHSIYSLYTRVFLHEIEFKQQKDNIAFILFNTAFQQNLKALYLDNCGRLVEKIPVELFMSLFNKNPVKRPTAKQFLASLGNFEEFRSDTFIYSSE